MNRILPFLVLALSACASTGEVPLQVSQQAAIPSSQEGIAAQRDVSPLLQSVPAPRQEPLSPTQTLQPPPLSEELPSVQEASVSPQTLTTAAPGLVPLELSELRGRKVALFPDVTAREAQNAVIALMSQCYGSSLNRRDEPLNRTSWYSADGSQQFTVQVTVVRNSSALALHGVLLDAEFEAALAQAVQGNAQCPQSAIIS